VSENLYLPLFLWAMYVTFSIPRNPKSTLKWHILNGVLIAASYLTRYITLAAIPFFCASWWIKPHEGENGLFKPGWRKVGYGMIFIASMLLAFSPWLLAAFRENLPLKLALGFSVTSKTNPEQLTVGNLLNWVFLYGSYFILLAAPVFNLLLAALINLDFKKWRDGFNRFIIQTLVVMAGFFVAVVRHSWRARYNLDGPRAIMGRYLIVFLPLYLIIAIVCISSIDKQKWKSRLMFTASTVVLPVILVFLSYLAIIRGLFIPTDGNLIKSLGSIDGFYISALENAFFPLLLIIYIVTSLVGWSDNQPFRRFALLACLMVFYLPGIPIYHFEVLGYQTYPWLAKQIAAQLAAPDAKTGELEPITVFMSQERGPKDGPEIYNGLRVRGYDNTISLVDTPESIRDMPTRQGFVLEALAECCEQEDGEPGCYEINDQCFAITKVEKLVNP
jgi:hypothetical protein